MQLLSRGVTDQTMRIKSMKLENKQLRQQLADKAALWHDLQHDLVALNGMREGKGGRQQVSTSALKPVVPHGQHACNSATSCYLGMSPIYRTRHSISPPWLPTKLHH